MNSKSILVALCLFSCFSASACRAEPPPIQPQITLIPTLVPTQKPSPTQPPTIAPTEITISYIVRQGDTLWGISQVFGVSVEALALANNIVDVGRITPGQILIISNPQETLSTTIETNKRIEVILSEQKVYAYEGDILIREFVVSTGVSDHPTVQGSFQTYAKLELARMTGDDYDLPNVPWTMYFYEGYSFHGTYWHSNFGHPMSHGCVNMYTPDAEWLFNWAPLGTSVLVLP